MLFDFCRIVGRVGHRLNSNDSDSRFHSSFQFRFWAILDLILFKRQSQKVLCWFHECNERNCPWTSCLFHISITLTIDIVLVATAAAISIYRQWPLDDVKCCFACQIKHFYQPITWQLMEDFWRCGSIQHRNAQWTEKTMNVMIMVVGDTLAGRSAADQLGFSQPRK